MVFSAAPLPGFAPLGRPGRAAGPAPGGRAVTQVPPPAERGGRGEGRSGTCARALREWPPEALGSGPRPAPGLRPRAVSRPDLVRVHPAPVGRSSRAGPASDRLGLGEEGGADPRGPPPPGCPAGESSAVLRLLGRCDGARETVPRPSGGWTRSDPRGRPRCQKDARAERGLTPELGVQDWVNRESWGPARPDSAPPGQIGRAHV